MLRCDVLVVGAGPAGSSAASEAAKGGAEVLLIEKKKTIGQPVQCAEFIPKPLLHEAEISQDCVVQEIRGMRTHLPNGGCIESNSPGYLLNRSLFDRGLAMEAVKRGATLLVNTSGVSRRGTRVTIDRNGTREEVIPEVIIGADGPRSTVGKWMHSINSDFIIGLQYEVPLLASQDVTEVYFHGDYLGGYGWLFPKRDSANVGLGVKYNPTSKANSSLKSLLEKFVTALEKDGKIKNCPISVTGGLIPVGGPLRTVEDNMMLVGDAAGQTHPITGGGIPQAIICGQIAGRTAARSIGAGLRDLLNSYQDEWRAIFGKELERARAKRESLESGWDNLDALVKDHWVAFREYYHE